MMMMMMVLTMLMLMMVQDLMNVNRNVTPWVIVHGHRPAYATVVDTASVIQAFEDIFVQTGVRLAGLRQYW